MGRRKRRPAFLMESARHWIAVVSREHVMIGVAGGFAMMNHGKEAPLRRLSPGDGLIYYSPKTAYPDGAPIKAFTAIGTIRDRAPYQVEIRPGFSPCRRDVLWQDGTETPIAALQEGLAFTQGNWGMLARRGPFPITPDDFDIIRSAMCAKGDTP